MKMLQFVWELGFDEKRKENRVEEMENESTRLGLCIMWCIIVVESYICFFFLSDTINLFLLYIRRREMIEHGQEENSKGLNYYWFKREPTHSLTKHLIFEKILNF